VRHGFGHTSQVSSSSGSDGSPAVLSELEVALLALLSIRPMTGYEILRHHARALEPWWETPRTQIYPKLRELQRRGLIEHEYVVQESKPNKRLYSIGPAGSEALASWLGSTINVPEMRHHMMMRLFLGTSCRSRRPVACSSVTGTGWRPAPSRSGRPRSGSPAR
jgi:DNA-binding PadR family transcriptional regulator